MTKRIAAFVAAGLLCAGLMLPNVADAGVRVALALPALVATGPVPRVAVRVVRPAPEAVWVEGYWTRDAWGRPIWVEGFWQVSRSRPRVAVVAVPRMNVRAARPVVVRMRASNR